MNDGRKVEVVYDRECPICDFHARNLVLRNSTDELHLIDARSNGPLMREITAAGLDIDAGMVVKIDDETYHGSLAMHKLVELGADSGFSNRVLRVLFRNRRVARALYPLLASFRRLLLLVLRRGRINNLGNQG